ncbi:hypothetical protein QKW52_00160 [Bacillus sonorensis]|nr:hypothetical protein [Bacillus sonorensis]
MLEGLAPVFNDESIGKVLHNAIFDIAMVRRHGFDLKGVVWDTMTAMHMLNENEEDRTLGGAGSFKLKDLAPKYLKTPSRYVRRFVWSGRAIQRSAIRHRASLRS